MNDIPQLVDLRVAYLNPSFEAIIKSQLAFNQAAYTKLESIQNSFPSDAQNGLEGRVENVLQQMRDLSICRN